MKWPHMTEEPLQVKYIGIKLDGPFRDPAELSSLLSTLFLYYSRPTRLKELIRGVKKKRVLGKKKRKATTTPAGS